MSKPSGSGLKSAYDLAMERMASKGEAIVHLTDDQKAAIAEIGRKTQAAIAELEILYAKRIAAAREGQDEEKAGQIEEELRSEIEKRRARAEAEKERIRKQE
jgi:hypothetical protein